MTSHLGENLVVADVRQHVERIGAALQSRHLIEVRAPRTVVPQDRDYRQLVARGSLHVPAADSQSAVAADHDDLLTRPRELRTDTHPDAVTDRRERTRVHHLAHEAACERAAHPSRQREAVDNGGRVFIEHGDQVLAQARGMNRLILRDLRVLLLDLIVEALTRLPDLLDPWRSFVLREVELEFLDPLDHLLQHDLRIADHRQGRVNLPSDACRRGIDLDVLGLVGPGGGWPKMLTAPEAEADREHHVGASRERLLERTANRQRMLLGHYSLSGATRIDRDVRQLDELAHLGARLRPEQSIAAGDQRT